MRLKSIMITALAALLALSCTKEGNGGVSFRITEGEVAEATKGSVSSYASLPSAADFKLVLSGPGSYSWTGGLSEWDASAALPAGKYSASVSYGSETDEGYDKPCFIGTSDFTVAAGSNTEVSIPVTLGNAVVKIVCSDTFKSYYTSSSFKVVTASNQISYTGGGVFVEAYRFSISGSVTAQNGQTYGISTQTYNAEAATCYTVRFDVNNAGSVSVSISFDDSVETVTLEEDLNQ